MGDNYVADKSSHDLWDQTLKVIVAIASMNEFSGMPNCLFPDCMVSFS